MRLKVSKMQLICDIANNINGKLHWEQWNDHERKVFTLCFYPDVTENADSIDNLDRSKSAKNLLIRHLFNKLDTRNPPKFISDEYTNISDHDIKMYREISSEARNQLLTKAKKRPPHFPPIK